MSYEVIPIQLDKERHLKFSLGSMVQIKRLTGKSFLKGELDLKDPEDFQALLWSMLYWEDHNLTPDDVGEMLTADLVEELDTFTDKMSKAVNASALIKEGDEDINPPQRPTS